MAVSLPGTIPVPLLLLLIVGVILIVVVMYAFFLTMFAIQIPYVMSQIITQIKRRPGVMMHYVNRRAEFFAPKRQGKKQQKNTLTLPEALGAKFDASGVGLEELYGKTVMYNYFSKASFPVSPIDAKAVNDFYKELSKRGIKVNEELIDVLLVEENDITDIYTKELQDAVLKALPIPIQTDKEYLLNETRIKQERIYLDERIKTFEDIINQEHQLTYEQNDEYEDLKARREVLESHYNELLDLKETKEELRVVIEDIEEKKKYKEELIWKIDESLGYIDPDTKKQIYSLKRIKKELEEKVIADGLFVYPKVHDMIFASSYLNSAGMSEAVNIANADAYAQNMSDKDGWNAYTMGTIGIILIVVLIGGGIAIKAAFG